MIKTSQINHLLEQTENLPFRLHFPKYINGYFPNTKIIFQLLKDFIKPINIIR